MQYIRRIHNPKPKNLMNRKEPKCDSVPRCDPVSRDKKIEPVPLKDLPLTNEIVTPELLEQQLNNLSGTLSNDITKSLESLIQTLSALFPKYVPLSGNVTIGGNLSVIRDLYHVQGKTVKPYVYDILSNLTRFNTNSQVVGAECLYDTLNTLSSKTNQKIEGVMEDVSRLNNGLDSLASNVTNEFTNIETQFEQVESRFSQVNSNIESVRTIATDAKQRADLANSSISSLADVARSGSYNDLKDKPVIPSDPPVSSVNGQTGDVVLDAYDVGAISLSEAEQGFTDWIVAGLSEDERILIYPKWQSPNKWSLVTSVKQYNAIGLNDAVNLTFLNSSVTAARVRLRPTPEQEERWNQKQDALIFDSKPTLDSLNPVTSNGVAVALSGVTEDLDKISTEITDITTELSNKVDASALDGKVDANSEGKVEVNRVVTNSIEDDAVTSAKIKDGAIVLEKLSQDVIDKINNAVSGVTGNFAGFDENGNLCDLGINAGAFAAVSALENLTDDMRSLRDSVNDLDDKVNATTAEVERISNDVGNLTTSIEDIQQNKAALSDVNGLSENIQSISSVLSSKTDLTTTSNLSAYDVDVVEVEGRTIQYTAGAQYGTYRGREFKGYADVAYPTSAVIQYSRSSSGPWQNEELGYVNAGRNQPVWIKITADGFKTVIDRVNVNIAPKQLTDEFVWLSLPPQDYVYDGTEKRPEVSFGDGSPSIMTENDFDVEFVNNIGPGTAKAIFTGKNNYTGTVEEEFEILPQQ